METKIHVAVEPAAAGAGQETGLKHGLGIGKVQLKNMTSGIEVKAHGEGVVGFE